MERGKFPLHAYSVGYPMFVSPCIYACDHTYHVNVVDNLLWALCMSRVAFDAGILQPSTWWC